MPCAGIDYESSSLLPLTDLGHQAEVGGALNRYR
jgi:hypothetical protein